MTGGGMIRLAMRDLADGDQLGPVIDTGEGA